MRANKNCAVILVALILRVILGLSVSFLSGQASAQTSAHGKRVLKDEAYDLIESDFQAQYATKRTNIGAQIILDQGAIDYLDSLYRTVEGYKDKDKNRRVFHIDVFYLPYPTEAYLSNILKDFLSELRNMMVVKAKLPFISNTSQMVFRMSEGTKVEATIQKFSDALKGTIQDLNRQLNSLSSDLHAEIESQYLGGKEQGTWCKILGPGEADAAGWQCTDTYGISKMGFLLGNSCYGSFEKALTKSDVYDFCKFARNTVSPHCTTVPPKSTIAGRVCPKAEWGVALDGRLATCFDNVNGATNWMLDFDKCW